MDFSIHKKTEAVRSILLELNIVSLPSINIKRYKYSSLKYFFCHLRGALSVAVTQIHSKHETDNIMGILVKTSVIIHTFEKVTCVSS